jgi:predicted ABC-class ATPase
VSSILVLGGSGDYFEVADTVIAMDSYVPAEVTAEARSIAAEMLAGTIHIDATFGKVAARVVERASIDTSVRTKVPTKECILFGETEIRLGAVEQLVEAGQTRFVCEALTRLPKAFLDGRRTLAQTLDALETAMDEGTGSSGLDCVNTREPRGDFVRPRRFEIAAAINRLRGVRMTHA